MISTQTGFSRSKTGHSVFLKQSDEIEESWMKTWTLNIPDMLMQDASWQNQIFLQWISDSPTAKYIDMEIETLRDDFLGGKSLIKYLRYDFPITENDLNSLNLGRDFSAEDVESLVEMSNSENRELLYDIGYAASKSVEEDHFDYLINS